MTSNKGFTLIELLVVVAMIAIIAGAFSTAVAGAQERAKIQKELSESEYRQADLQIALNRAETCSATCSNLIRQFAKPTQHSASQF